VMILRRESEGMVINELDSYNPHHPTIVRWWLWLSSMGIWRWCRNWWTSADRDHRMVVVRWRWLAMRRNLYGLTFALFALYATPTYSASVNLAFNLSPGVVLSTTIGCPVAYPAGQNSFTVPVAPGTKMATCTMTPTQWVGTIALSGPDASFFTVSGKDIVVGGTALTNPRVYNVTVTSTP
jgi:hypothetical protein